MTTTTPPLQVAVEVTTPSGRHLVTRDPLLVAECRYPEHDGYRVREVHGYPMPGGFRIVHHIPAGQEAL